MRLGLHRFLCFLLLVAPFLPFSCRAQRPGGGSNSGVRTGIPSSGDLGVSNGGQLTVYVREPNGSPVKQMTIVSVTMLTQQYFKQLTTQGGYAAFTDVVAGRYSVQAIAPGFEKTTEEVEVGGMNTTSTIDLILRPIYNSSGAVGLPGPPILAPKVQKQLGQALLALQANKLSDAKHHLDAAIHLAPNHPEVTYLYGIYCNQSGDPKQAVEYWNRTLQAFPQHTYTRLALGDVLLRQGKYADAAADLKRALEYDPSSWRVQLLYAKAILHLHDVPEAETHARRALELGHAQASEAHLLLAEASFERGDPAGAATQLRTYLQQHPGDPTATKALENLHANANGNGAPPQFLTVSSSAVSSAALPPSLKWLPPDVDEIVPPVEGGVACQLPSLLQNASTQVQEFLNDVDRFTATETLKHESINAWGAVTFTENRKFEYMVSFKQLQPGRFTVEEYRDGGMDLGAFPEKIATIGLPSLMLVFDKSQSGNYNFTCEGLTRWHDGLAWQVHFIQRPDKPKVLRAYRLGSQSYPIAIKGRAWISVDTYQILRMETDLAVQRADIRLNGEHIDLEYGPAVFAGQTRQLWVPQNAEIYLDWQGHRIHRKHSFSNFLLFSVDENMKIAAPKNVPAGPEQPGAEPATEPKSDPVPTAPPASR